MSQFVNTDPNAFRGVWVFCEQREGTLNPTDFELLSEGRKLADDLGVELCGLLLGDEVAGLARELGGYGADRVYVCEHPRLRHYTTDAYTKVICDVVMEKKPEIVLIGATNIGRDLGPRCAARLHTGLTADCTHLDVDVAKYKEFLKSTSTLDVDGMKFDENDRGLKMTRPAFGGHLMATIICPRFRPCMATVLEVVKEAKTAVDLIGAEVAEVVVSVGYGISKDVKRGLELAQELADALHGVVGASRAAVDAGWISADHQVGQTGKTVRPRIYIALGISGAIQHKAGMQDSECIIAVNSNPDAPVFEAADFGIVGDLFQVAPLMVECAKEA